LPKVSRNLRVLTADMRYGRALLAGLGWAGALGGLALCVLLFLSAYLAFDGHGGDLRSRDPDVVRLPSVPDSAAPGVPLARRPARPARARAARGRAAARRRGGRRTRAPGAAPGTRTAPRAITPGGTPQAPSAGGGAPPAAAPPSRPPSSGGSGGGSGSAPPPPPPPSLGDATREVVTVVGTQVGRVSPPAGEVVIRAGDTVGDAVDRLDPLVPR